VAALQRLRAAELRLHELTCGLERHILLALVVLVIFLQLRLEVRELRAIGELGGEVAALLLYRESLLYFRCQEALLRLEHLLLFLVEHARRGLELLRLGLTAV